MSKLQPPEDKRHFECDLHTKGNYAEWLWPYIWGNFAFMQVNEVLRYYED